MAPKQNLVNLFRESAGMSPESQAYAQAYGNDSKFRIVKEKRGDVIVGFRVQIESYGRRGARIVSGLAEQSEHGFYWRNIGRRTYSIEEARAYRQFLEQFYGKRESVTEEVIE